LNITGKVAIVSGAAQGLGKAFAKRLADEGCEVLGFDIDERVTQIDGIHGVVADASKRADVERVVAQALDIGKLGVLINNAGTWRHTPVESSWEQALADWDYIMYTILNGVMMLSWSVIPHMQKSGGGHIINAST
jgi:NAD(P)-dependent dehydrogenase (short-subunit alcohol dehydrogenase family)